MWPALLLWLRGRTEFVDEPFLYQGMSPGQGFQDGGMHQSIINQFRYFFAEPGGNFVAQSLRAASVITMSKLCLCCNGGTLF
jgi:hypothetical protein